MTDYSKMSDFEINWRVFEFLHNGAPDFKEGENGAMVVTFTANDVQLGEHVEFEIEGESFNPCNSWADAGPIIAKNKISLDFDVDGYEPPQNAWCKTSTPCGQVYYGGEIEPLRAAMIVFLMMKDSQNDS